MPNKYRFVNGRKTQNQLTTAKLPQRLRLGVDVARRLVVVAAAAVAPLVDARIDQHSHLLPATIIPATT
jgi:hypothetical protein